MKSGIYFLLGLVAVLVVPLGFLYMIEATGPDGSAVYCDGFGLGAGAAQVRAMQSGHLVEELPACTEPDTAAKDAAIRFCEGAASGYVTVLEPFFGPPPATFAPDYIEACVAGEMGPRFYQTGGGAPPQDL